MLRLTFVSDIGRAAPEGEPVSSLSNVLEMAAEESETPSLDSLLQWVREKGEPLFDKVLPYKRYRELQEDLRRKKGDQTE
jgi:hypothetical protein